MRKLRFLLILVLALTFVAGTRAATSLPYDTVPGDPLKTRIYTLPNGLKVMLSVNKDTPRIQTYIAVRVGGKNDPAETTGLAHYFEHLMFKGTEQFGTTDYAAEKPLLDAIETDFETYRHTTDPDERARIYAHIDSLSYAASLIAIPNEYDKLMSAIGAQGSNAFTSNDVTCYTENIPSNQIENWARIQADRFAHPVLRGFHTELETIYEEKNMSLKDDSEKAVDALMNAMFPAHPYGTQTVLGTQEHLKNPSITNVKNYHAQWYVPNNMAVIMAGDFNPDEAVEIIEKYFGDFRPNPTLTMIPRPDLTPLAEPVEKEVVGPESEYLYLGWRIPGGYSDEGVALEMISQVLQNGYSGIIDNNVTRPQALLSSGVYPYQLADGGIFLLQAEPKAGQTLEEARDILLAQIDSLRNGSFSESLVEAVRNNYKMRLQRRFESNDARVSMLLESFTSGRPWAKAVADLDSLDAIDKTRIVEVANKYLTPGGYAAIYKRQGEATDVAEIAKPKITPIATNRDAASPFLLEIVASEVEPIQPHFVDYSTELTVLTAKGDTPVYYTRNATNDVFTLTYVYETGTTAIPYLAEAASLLEYASTPTMTAAEISDRFYSLACRWSISVGQERTYFTLYGLSENMDKAIALFDTLLKGAEVDEQTYTAFLENLQQERINEKTQEAQSFYALRLYQMYGPKNPVTDRPTPDALRATGSKALFDSLRGFLGYRHRTIYYGPDSEQNLLAELDKTTPDNLAAAPAPKPYEVLPADENVIFVAPYEMPQADYYAVSRLPGSYDPATEPARRLYNAYFGGGMNAIVFQEMRESRSLAYSASAGMTQPSRADRPYTFYSYIATQIDKLPEAMAAFDEIIEDMPESQAAFDLAKKSTLDGLRTERTIKDNIAWSYIAALDLGLDADPDQAFFAVLPEMTFDDIKNYKAGHVKGRNYRIAILGLTDKIDFEALAKRGRVVRLTAKDIFGY